MKKITLFLAIMIISISARAQSYVTIPDPYFVSWLNINIPSAMMGNQMDTTSTAVTSLTSMNISNDSIFDLAGIQYFSGLQTLDCSYNQLDTLAQLPNSLLSLDCSYNYISSLPALPPSLQFLQCRRNALISLPALPASITQFDCRQNQLNSLPALPPSLPELICSYNLLAALPALPASITRIECETNELNSLPALPPSLIFLNCSDNPLGSLPSTLPTTLATLYCNTNQLTFLPSLPSSLTELECYDNNLTALPSLPFSLLSLTCSGNPLGTLPSLPASLTSLKCYNDSLSLLPALPASLNYLDCSNNQLSFLPALPSALATLNCSRNLLTWIPVLPGSLTEMNCDQNQVTALPALNSLNTLYCQNNLLSTLPVIPTSLQTLACGFNPLDSLPSLNSVGSLSCDNATLDSLPALPATLYSLNCSFNLLDSLPSLPTSLSTLYCNNNQLMLLPSLPGSLSQLYCSNNLLTSLPVLNASLGGLDCSNNTITCMPEFPNAMTWLSLGGNPFTCLENYIPAMDSITLNYPLCVLGDLVSNPNNCPSARGLVGFTYADVDSDCTKDTLDTPLTRVPMKIYDNLGALIGQTYTASNGVFSFVETAGTYTAVIDTLGLPFIPMCSTPGIDSTVTTTIAMPLASDINFDLNCKPGFDVGVQSVVNTGITFPGQSHQLQIVAGDMTQWYNMACAAGLPGTVEVKVIGPVSYQGPAAGALAPVVTGSMYTYSIADFGAVSNTQAFRMMFKVDTTAMAGDDIGVYVSVTPVGGDNDTSNNLFSYHYTVVNSHDPNYKETTPLIVTPAYDDYFTYTVHFQNTGNAPAINIAVADTLDSNLDPSTFQLINFSHENNVSLTGNVLHISFPEIWLADSTSSADSSMGFFQYRIKAKKSRPMGTHIYNTAFIYFDYNEAVITNTTVNMYEGQVPQGISSVLKQSDWSIYPNPASENLTVRVPSRADNYSVKIFDATGRLIKAKEKITAGENILSVADLEKGLYLLVVSDGRTTQTKRFVKQ